MGNPHIFLEYSTKASLLKLLHTQLLCQVELMWCDDVAGHHTYLRTLNGVFPIGKRIMVIAVSFVNR